MKKSFYFLFLLLFIFPLNFSFAQEKSNVGQAAEWHRLESDNGEFSVELPAGYTYFSHSIGLIFENPDDSVLQYAEMQLLNASHGKTVASVEIYKVRSQKKHLDFLLDRQDLKASKLAAPENFIIKQVETSSVKSPYGKKEKVPVSFVMRFIASKTHLYIVTVAARGATKTPEFERVLSSIRLNESQSGNTKISTLNPLPIEDIVDYVAEPSKPRPPAPIQSKPPGAPQNPTPILILSKPNAPYTAMARATRTSGIIRLRVTFNKNGGISKIGVVSGLGYNLNRSAIFAALLLKFIPEEKDGVPVTVTKVVEYSFQID
jgi:TonB family protein